MEAFKPDVLLSDIGMPQMDGYALIRRIRLKEEEQKQSRFTPAIALTAYTREEDQTQALSAGFQMFLSKPVDSTDLVSAMCRLLKSLEFGVFIPHSSLFTHHLLFLTPHFLHLA